MIHELDVQMNFTAKLAIYIFITAEKKSSIKFDYQENYILDKLYSRIRYNSLVHFYLKLSIW